MLESNTNSASFSFALSGMMCASSILLCWSNGSNSIWKRFSVLSASKLSIKPFCQWFFRFRECSCNFLVRIYSFRDPPCSIHWFHSNDEAKNLLCLPFENQFYALSSPSTRLASVGTRLYRLGVMLWSLFPKNHFVYLNINSCLTALRRAWGCNEFLTGLQARAGFECVTDWR